MGKVFPVLVLSAVMVMAAGTVSATPISNTLNFNSDLVDDFTTLGPSGAYSFDFTVPSNSVYYLDFLSFADQKLLMQDSTTVFNVTINSITYDVPAFSALVFGAGTYSASVYVTSDPWGEFELTGLPLANFPVDNTPLPPALPLMGTVLGLGYLTSMWRRRRANAAPVH
jgi:hypothetical protein